MTNKKTVLEEQIDILVKEQEKFTNSDKNNDSVKVIEISMVIAKLVEINDKVKKIAITD